MKETPLEVFEAPRHTKRPKLKLSLQARHGAAIKVEDRYLLKVDRAISQQQSLSFYTEFTELGSDRVLVNINTPINHLHPTLFPPLSFIGVRLTLILTSGFGTIVPIS